MVPKLRIAVPSSQPGAPNSLAKLAAPWSLAGVSPAPSLLLSFGTRALATCWSVRRA